MRGKTRMFCRLMSRLIGGVIIILTAQPLLCAEAPSTGHFPLLHRLLDTREGGGAAKALGPEDSRALLDEIAVERLLWKDELDRLRRRAASSAEAVSRIENTRAEVQRQLDALAASIAEGKPEESLLRRILSTGAAEKAPPILSGGGLRIPAPIHREAPEAKPVPEGCWDAPAPVERKDHAKSSSGEADTIDSLAAELGDAPVALYQYVLHNIRPVNAYGLSRSPEAVLAAGEGTGADQAALLAALLRSAGYPARLGWGVQQLSIPSLRRHFGIEGPQLETALTEGGYAWSPVVEAGRVVAYRVSRIWCQAWLPASDYRGIDFGGGDATWLQLDPWIKDHAEWPERRILEEMDFDTESFGVSFLSGQMCSGALDQSGACPTVVEALASEIDAYLSDHGETTSFEELAVGRESTLEEEKLLPLSMVGRLISIEGFGIELPEELRFRLHLRVRAEAETLLETDMDVADLSGGEAVVWYEPAGEEDADVVEALGGYLWDVPPYLVNVTPVVMVGRDVLAEGELGRGMGRSLEYQWTMSTPAGTALSWSNEGIAGVPVGLGVAAGRQGYQTPYEDPASTIQLLSKLGSDYLDSVVADEEQLAAVDQLVRLYRMPSTVMVSAVIEPQGELGMVTNLDFLGIQLDADIWGSDVVGGDRDRRKAWRELSRLDASTLERGLFEEYGITSVSADMALILAQDQGVQVLHVDAGNLGAALGQLPYDGEVESEIEAWVLAGGEAYVPVAPLDFVQWSGVGYVLTDPETGEAKYQLAGGVRADSMAVSRFGIPSAPHLRPGLGPDTLNVARATPRVSLSRPERICNADERKLRKTTIGPALSGGMTAVPPDLIPLELRDPLEYPSTDEVNPDPASAVSIEIFGHGNLQEAEVGSLLTVVEGHLPLRVIVRDSKNHPVKNVPVNVSLLAGGGVLESGATATTGPFGVAVVHLRLGQHTVDAPYFGKVDSEDEYLTQYGLNIVTASISGVSGQVSLKAPFYLFGKPGPVSELVPVGPTEQETLPNTSLPNSFVILPRDGFGNPVSNQAVTFELADQIPGDTDLGPALLREKDCCRVNMIIGQECAGSARTIEAAGPPQGVQIRMIVGPEPGQSYDVNVTATPPEGEELTLTLTGRASALDLPPGEPMVVISSRMQPGNSAWQVVEAYAPGQAGQDLSTSLAVLEQRYTVEPCPACDTQWKIVGTGEYRTRRVVAGLELPDCGGEGVPGCEGTEEPVTARVEYSSSGPGLTVTQAVDEAADAYGIFSSVPLIMATGRHTVTATGRVNWRFPVVHQETPSGDNPVEVLTDGNGGLLGARLDWAEIPEDGVSVDYTIWGVEASVSEPVPIVVLHHGWMHEGNNEFHYTIDPPTYPALATDMVFAEDGHDVLVASALGNGTGTMTLGQGEFFRDPAAPHTVRMRINQGWGWWLGSTLVRMGMAHEPQGLPVVDISIKDVLTDPEEDPNPILDDGECPESVLEGEFDVKKCGPAKVEYRVTSSLCDASVDAARFEVEYDPGNEAHRDFYDLVPDDFMVSMEADPDPTPGDTGAYEFEWDGRDDTDDERILLGGKFLVKVEADLTVTGDGWSEAVTEDDSIWQEIAKPHASNYGVDYGTFDDNFSLWAGEFAVIMQSEFRDGSGFAAWQNKAALPSNVIERLKGRDALMGFTGHGSAGVLGFRGGPPGEERFAYLFADAQTESVCRADPQCRVVLDAAGEIRVLSQELGAESVLEDVKLVVLMGCETGIEGGEGFRTFGDILIAHGVDIVISTPGPVNKSVGSQWGRFFWPLITQEENLPDVRLLGRYRGLPATIRNTVGAAGLAALRYGSNITQEDEDIMENLVIQVNSNNPDAADQRLYPARYGLSGRQ